MTKAEVFGVLFVCVILLPPKYVRTLCSVIPLFPSSEPFKFDFFLGNSTSEKP